MVGGNLSTLLKNFPPAFRFCHCVSQPGEAGTKISPCWEVDPSPGGVPFRAGLDQHTSFAFPFRILNSV